MATLADINNEIEQLRLILNTVSSESPLTASVVVEISQKLDLLIMLHYELSQQLRCAL
ncbi:aspartyl-phosphate phosphatase Spo0E family protein [Paenibacillus methanolicus]|uniref:Spo0E like sporulation regulatory protein n=1 Tax=Paenibacillus methanolicus TaxID=582686 RepID=A0A5S5BZI5_9BACL|nr:aspartyl-phosphate phosphatase Spo0E family protein [Paenibacillus methanolicus]TYP72595.1 Spo0E like sporulation regulatory protein [Paenibacillus methanolicus]